MTKILLNVVTLLIFAGCATQYQKSGFTGGFTEAQISRNEFTVAFSGNGYTSGQRAIDLCTLRCAEITLGHGFRYFALIENRSEYDRSTMITTGSFIPIGYGSSVFLSSTQTIPKPSTRNRILCFRQQPEALDKYFDAQRVYDEISKKYGIRKEIEQLPKFNAAKATLGIEVEAIVPAVDTNFRGGGATPAIHDDPQIRIRSFTEGSKAEAAGLRVKDQILSIKNISISKLGKIQEVTDDLEIGENVDVKFRRNGKEQMASVQTIFDPVLRFR